MIFDFFRVGIRHFLPVVALCCLVPTALAAPAPPAPAASAALTDGVKQAVQTAYEAQDAALVTQDASGVMAIYTPTVVFFDSLTGKQNAGTAGARKEWLTLFHAPHQTLTASRHEIKELTVNKAGTGATVLAVHHLTMNRTKSTAAASATEVNTTLRTFWVKTGGGWQIKQERILGVDTFLNGKRVQHNHKQVPT